MLLLDIDKCFGCLACRRAEPALTALIERGIRAAVCRKCANPPCVAACPVGALIKNNEGLIERLTMRCTGCRQCSPACPVGANPAELLDYRMPSEHRIRTSACKNNAMNESDTLPEGWIEIPGKIGLSPDNWRG